MEAEYDFKDEFLDDVEVFENEPEFDAPTAIDETGRQDDDTDVPDGLGFMARVVSSVRTWREALFWYITHQTTKQIGFNPDGMCLKVCRTARNIPAKYLSAKEAQDATPNAFRVYNIRDLRKGMIVYFDDNRDSNRFGHVATLIGRVRGVDPDSLSSLLLETNNVKSGELVIVRGDYFQDYWGDEFKFGATWLNGVEFDVAGSKTKVERFNNGGPVYNLNLLAKAHKDGRERVGRVLVAIETQVKRLPDSSKLPRVREFKEEWRDTRKIDLNLLDEVVKTRPNGLVRRCRDEIKRLIETLPDV